MYRWTEVGNSAEGTHLLIQEVSKMTTQLNYRGVKYNGTITHKTIESQEMLYRGVKHNPTLREQWIPATSGIYRGSKWSV